MILRSLLLYLCFIIFAVMPFVAAGAVEPCPPPVYDKGASIDKDLRAVSGFWSTEDNEAVVELYICGKRLCGKFHWLEDDSANNPTLDERNPDQDKQRRPLCGLQFMGGFEPAVPNKFMNGWIYSPRHGSMFSANISYLEDNKLELRGYMFIPFLGQSQIWKRTKNEPFCNTSIR